MKRLILTGEAARKAACREILAAPEGYVVKIEEPKRNLDQSAKFHALCGDIAKSSLPWAGKPRTAAQWKVLLVSGHAVVTNHGAEMVPGIEAEFVNIRESTALMSKKRAASLIEYAMAFCATNGVKLSARDEL